MFRCPSKGSPRRRGAPRAATAGPLAARLSVYRHWLSTGVVTVGLGAALATGQGVALADETSDSPDESTSSSASEPQSTPGVAASSSGTGSSGSASAGGPTGPSPNSTVSAQTTTSDDDDDDTDSSATDGTPTATDSATTQDTELPATESDFDTDGSEGGVTEEPATPDVLPANGSEKSPQLASGSKHASALPKPPEAGPLAAQPQRTFDTHAAADLTDQDVADISTLDGPASSQRISASSFNATTLVASVAESDPPPTAVAPPVTWTSVVSDVLRWFGLPPLATDSSIPATPVPPPLEALWLLTRRFEHTFFNDAPTIAVGSSTTQYVGDDYQVHVRGTTTASDPDGDTTTLSLPTAGQPGAPANGTVALSGTTFTYTPNESWDGTTQLTDSFTVIASDEGPHLHGLFGFFQPGGGHTVSKTITVAVAPDPAILGTVTTVGLFVGPRYSADGSRTYLISDSIFLPDNAITTRFTVVDTATGQVIGAPIVRTSQRSMRYEFSQDGRYAFASGLIEDHEAGNSTVITVIDTTTGTVVGNPLTLNGTRLDNPVISPDGTRLYQATGVYNAELESTQTLVTAVDIATCTTVGNQAAITGTAQRFRFTGRDFVLVVNEDGTRVFAFGEISDPATGQPLPTTVFTTIDTADMTVVGEPLSLGGSYFPEIYTSADGTRAYHMFRGFWSDGRRVTAVTMIDTADSTVVGTQRVVYGFADLQLSEDGERAFLVSVIEDDVAAGTTYTGVHVIDTADASRVGDPVYLYGYSTGFPNPLVLNQGETRAYLTTYYEDEDLTGIYIFDTIDGTLLAEEDVPAVDRLHPTVAQRGRHAHLRRRRRIRRSDDTHETIVTVLDSADATFVGSPVTIDHQLGLPLRRLGPAVRRHPGLRSSHTEVDRPSPRSSTWPLAPWSLPAGRIRRWCRGLRDRRIARLAQTRGHRPNDGRDK